MKIAFCTYPLISAHKDRGIGVYTQNLLDYLKSQKRLDVITFDNPMHAPDADITHYPFFDLFFHTLPIIKKNKRIITVHDVIPIIFPEKFPVGFKGRINFFLQKTALKNSNAIICDSQTSKHDVIEKFKIKNNKVYTVYLAQSQIFKITNDHKLLNNVKNKFSLPDKFIIFVGDVNWNKNIENLIKSAKIANVPLVLVGESHLKENLDEVKKTKLLINDLKLNDSVIKTGNVTQNELVALYNLASAAVLPSFYEGFGFPVLESMACGTPVVCSNNSSLAEIGGKLAFYCDPKSENNIAVQIQKAIKFKNSQNAKKLLNHASNFTWEKVGNQTIDIYSKTLNTK